MVIFINSYDNQKSRLRFSKIKFCSIKMLNDTFRQRLLSNNTIKHCKANTGFTHLSPQHPKMPSEIVNHVILFNYATASMLKANSFGAIKIEILKQSWQIIEIRVLAGYIKKCTIRLWVVNNVETYENKTSKRIRGASSSDRRQCSK